MQGVPYFLSGQALGDAMRVLSTATSCSDDHAGRQARKPTGRARRRTKDRDGRVQMKTHSKAHKSTQGNANWTREETSTQTHQSHHRPHLKGAGRPLFPFRRVGRDEGATVRGRRDGGKRKNGMAEGVKREDNMVPNIHKIQHEEKQKCVQEERRGEEE